MLTEYVGNIYSPPEAGHVFVIGGKTIDGADRLDIEFRAGKAAHDDVQLWLSFRFNTETVIRNSLLGDKWGDNEVEENVNPMTISNPLSPGERFRVYILISQEHFHIAVNNIHFCTYKHRADLHGIRTLKVTKDVQFVNQVDQRSVYPIVRPLVQNNDDFLTFSNDVPSKFQPGHAIILTAIPYGNPKGRFVVSFSEKDSKKQALHFNPRFEHNLVVRTSTRDDLSYREEERNGNFPFVFDQQFKLVIALSTTSFLIAVDGKRFCTYKYHTKDQLEVLNGLKIFCLDGMRMEVSAIDHIYCGSPTCRDFESFSNPDIELY